MLEEIQKNIEERMYKTIVVLEDTFSKIRTGRANPSLLEQIKVNYYDSVVPISQVAKISIENARTLKISLWEKNIITAVEKAIISSNLGLNPQTMGNTIYVPIPLLTEECRQNLVKLIKEEAEKSKVAIRNIRREANSNLKELLKTKEISQDETRRAEEIIQKTTNSKIVSIDKKLAQKEKSLLKL